MIYFGRFKNMSREFLVLTPLKRGSPSPPTPLEKGLASDGRNKTEATVGLARTPEARGFLLPAPLRSLAPGDRPPQHEDTPVTLWGRETKILHRQPCERATLECVLQPRGDPPRAPRTAALKPLGHRDGREATVPLSHCVLSASVAQRVVTDPSSRRAPCILAFLQPFLCSSC